VREALLDVTDSVSGAAEDAYDQGSRYVQQAGERYSTRSSTSRRPASRDPPGDQEPAARAVHGRSGRVCAGLDDPWSTARPGDPRARSWPHKARIRSTAGTLTRRQTADEHE
jgi:hypothetical protein